MITEVTLLCRPLFAFFLGFASPSAGPKNWALLMPTVRMWIQQEEAVRKEGAQEQVATNDEEEYAKGREREKKLLPLWWLASLALQQLAGSDYDVRIRCTSQICNMTYSSSRRASRG